MIETLERITLLDRDFLYKSIDIIREHNKLVENENGICFFIKVNDLEIYKIREDIEYLKTNMKELFLSEGDNLHICGLILDKPTNIFKGLKELIKQENPKSISWWNKDMTNCIYRRIKWGS